MMIVDTNTEHISKTEHVEFVNYTGSFPNLCRGVLTLKIDGEIVKFGQNSMILIMIRFGTLADG